MLPLTPLPLVINILHNHRPHALAAFITLPRLKGSENRDLGGKSSFRVTQSMFKTPIRILFFVII